MTNPCQLRGLPERHIHPMAGRSNVRTRPTDRNSPHRRQEEMPLRNAAARSAGPWRTYLTGLVGVVLTTAVILYPKDAFEASVSGLKLWFDIVLPALLPFFVMSEMLMGLGVIHFIGVVLEPFMRPLFRIPGAGAFAIAIGLAAGYPLGAKVAGDLARAKLTTSVEGERLVAFANTADPLFLVGAVAVGMYGLPELGGTLAVSHYAAVICVGLLMRFHAPKGPATYDPPRRSPLWPRALAAMHEARLKDGRPVGQLFGDAVVRSMNSLLLVGGTIVMFSVLIRMLAVTGAVTRITAALAPAMTAYGLDATLLEALIKGTVEITNGAQAASVANAPLLYKAVATAAIVGWSGLSVHAQVAAMVHGTDIRVLPYVAARLLHGVLAAAFAWLLLRPASGVVDLSFVPVVAPAWAAQTPGFVTSLFHATAWATHFGLAAWALVGVGRVAQRCAVFWARLR